MKEKSVDDIIDCADHELKLAILLRHVREIKMKLNVIINTKRS